MLKSIEPKKYYALPSEKQEKTLQNIVAATQKTDNTLIKAMLKVTEKTLKHYKSDFFIHDICTLSQSNNNRYVWLVHENGTFLIKLNHDFAFQSNESQAWLQAVNNNYGYRNTAKVYIVDEKKSTLTKVDSLTDKRIKFTHVYVDIETAIKDKTKHLDYSQTWEIMKQWKNIHSIHDIVTLTRKATLKAI